MNVFLDAQDEGLRDKLGAVQSVEVNLVGVNETEFRRWEQMSMTKYWEPDNKIRLNAKKHVMTFGQGHPNEQSLRKNAPIWREWLSDRKATHVFILGYLPWIRDDQPGDADPRRIILPLKVSQWEWYLWGADTIRVQLGSGGITCLRKHKREK